MHEVKASVVLLHTLPPNAQKSRAQAVFSHTGDNVLSADELTYNIHSWVRILDNCLIPLCKFGSQDTRSGELVKRIAGATNRIKCLAFSPVGNVILSSAPIV